MAITLLVIGCLITAICGNLTTNHTFPLYDTVDAVVTTVGQAQSGTSAAGAIASKNDSTTVTTEILTQNSTVFATPTCTIGQSCHGFNFTGMSHALSTLDNGAAGVSESSTLPEITVTSFRSVTTVLEITVTVDDDPVTTSLPAVYGNTSPILANATNVNGTSLSSGQPPAMCSAPIYGQNGTMIYNTSSLPFSSAVCGNMSIATTTMGNWSWSVGSSTKSSGPVIVNTVRLNKTVTISPLPTSTEVDTTIFMTSLVMVTTILPPSIATPVLNTTSYNANTTTSTLNTSAATSSNSTNVQAASTSDSVIASATTDMVSTTTISDPFSAPTISSSSEDLSATSIQSSTSTLSITTKANSAAHLRAPVIFTWLNLIKNILAQSTETSPGTSIHSSDPQTNTSSGTPVFISVAITVTEILTRTTLIQLSSLPVSTTFSQSLETMSFSHSPESSSRMLFSSSSALLSSSSFQLPLSLSISSNESTTTHTIPSISPTPITSLTTLLPIPSPHSTITCSLPFPPESSKITTPTSITNPGQLYWNTTATLPAWGLFNTSIPLSPNTTTTTRNTHYPLSYDPTTPLKTLTSFTYTVVNKTVRWRNEAAHAMNARFVEDTESLRKIVSLVCGLVVLGLMALIIL